MASNPTDDGLPLVALKPGTKLVSQVCTTEIVVVRAPDGPVALCCGGHPMVPVRGAGGAAIDPAHAAGSQVGKRYGDERLGVQVLCSHAGDGSLSIDGTMLQQVDTKSLPSSD